MLKERKALIRKLQTQLRNEEMSLVLLKKIRQSQENAEKAKAEAAKVSIQPASASSGHHRQSQSNHGTPPPSQVSASKRGSGVSSSANMSNARSHGGINAHAAGQNMKHVLTPDLSILKPVSSVRLSEVRYKKHKTVLVTTSLANFYLIRNCDDFCKFFKTTQNCRPNSF